MTAYPPAGLALSLCGGSYLGWLGFSLIARSGAPGVAYERHSTLPTSLIGVTALQLLNPKAWLLVTTATAAISGVSGLLTLAVLLVLITSLCLSIWAIAGAALSRMLDLPTARKWFERAMGGLLLLSAAGIVADAIT